jgi:hypothetical protein
MKLTLSAFFISSFLSVITLGADAPKNSDPKPQMHALAQEISSLQRFLLSEAEFLKPENEAAIMGNVGAMRKHLKELEGKGGALAEDPVLRTNLNLLERHMSDVSQAMKAGHKPYARYMLQSSLSMCIACHTRGKVQWDFALPGDSPGQNVPPLDRADFLFATRQFDKGRKIFERVVDGYPDNVDGYPGKKITRLQLQHALESLAVYFARVKEDPKAGAKYFKGVSRESWLSDTDQAEFRSWSKYFEAWSKEKAHQPKSASEFLAAAKSALGPDDLKTAGPDRNDFYIRRLRATALLHGALEAPGDAHSPPKGEALYLLGRIYQRLNHQFFFRFGEMYLRACVEEYKQSAIAQRCFGSLEQAVKEGYTGSGGTSIPAEESQELDRLKKIAF